MLRGCPATSGDMENAGLGARVARPPFQPGAVLALVIQGVSRAFCPARLLSHGQGGGAGYFHTARKSALRAMQIAKSRSRVILIAVAFGFSEGWTPAVRAHHSFATEVGALSL